MIQKIKQYADKYNMLATDDTVVVGVSGGADSVCLLFALREIKKDIPFTLTAVHVNHGIRETALRDEQYVEQLCDQWKIPLIKRQIYALELAQKEKTSVEEAGREARYQIFEEVRQEELNRLGLPDGKGKIAVAHNSNDNAETMLFNLFRGSNLRGLSGIQPVRDHIIRPLLTTDRTEIEVFLSEHGIDWKEDETNQELTYTRNRIRHQILPLISEAITPRAVQRLSETACELRDVDEYLTDVTNEAYNRCVTISSKGLLIDKSGFDEYAVLIQKRLLYRCMVEKAGRAKDVTAAHVAAFYTTFSLAVSKKVSLPYHLTAIREYEGVLLCHEDLEKNEQQDAFSILVPIPGELVLESNRRVSFRLLPPLKIEEIPEKRYTKWIDYDKITKYLEIRYRRKGDYLVVGKHGERKSLKDYMINEKIPLKERDEVLVLADGDEIVWVVGYRLSARYKLTQDTRKLLEINIGGNEYG